MARHKWDRKVGTTQWGSAAYCVKCGCVKETIKGRVTYFIDDTVYDGKAPKCDERILYDYKFFYRTDDEVNRLILPGTVKDGRFISVKCPFCHTKHIHSPEEGHRVAHCGGRDFTVKAFDGVILCSNDGYFTLDTNRRKKIIYSDMCQICDKIFKPELVYPVDKGLIGIYICDNCTCYWRTWYADGYEEFLSRIPF